MGRFLLFLFFVLTSAAHAKQEPFRVAIIDKAPFGVRDGDKLKGVHVHVAELVAKKTGRPVQISLMPPRRIIEFLRMGRVDWTIMVDTVALEKLKTKRAPLATVVTSIYTLASHPPIVSKDQLDKKLGRITDGCIDLSDQKSIVWTEFKSYDQCIDNLLIGRIPGICATDAMKSELKRRKVGTDQIKAHPISNKFLSIHTKDSLSEAQWKEVEAAAAEIMKDNKLDQIFLDYINAQ